MKIKYFLGFLLILIGTNLFCYATTRYWTTEDVLRRAQQRMDGKLKDEGLGAQPQFSGRAPTGLVTVSISLAGGKYYSWKDGLISWAGGTLFICSGFLVMCYHPRKKDAPAVVSVATQQISSL